MKLYKVVIVLFLTQLTSLMPARAQVLRTDPDLKSFWNLHEIYTNRLAAIDEKFSAQNKSIAQQYLNSLDQLALTYQNKGELKSLMAVRTERELAKQQLIPGADTYTDPTELRDLKSATRVLPMTLAAQRAKEVSGLANAYLTRLSTLQTELTKRGKVDIALQIQKEAEAITAMCNGLASSASVSSDLCVSTPLSNHPSGVQTTVPTVSTQQPDAEVHQQVAMKHENNPASMQAALIATISDDVQQAQNALAAKNPFLAVSSYRNAQTLSLIIQHDPEFDARSKAIADSLISIDSALKTTPFVVICKACDSKGEVPIELQTLAGSQPIKNGPLCMKTCSACRGRKKVSKILDEEERKVLDGEAEKSFGDLHAANRVQVGQTWIPSSVATLLPPRLRVVLIKSRMNPTCTECKGKMKQGCYSCSGQGLDRCNRCVNGMTEEHSYYGGRSHTKQKKCSFCSGAAKVTCSACNGTGISSTDCYLCRGTGRMKTCTNCSGTGLKACYCGGRSDSCSSCSGEGTMVCNSCDGTGASRY